MTTYKGLRTTVEYAKKCPRGYYVKFFARKTKTGYRIETSRYLNEDHVSIYPRIYGGWTEINREMYRYREYIITEEGRVPSLTDTIKNAIKNTNFPEVE
nr:MAG TPA: hypothetical protein [Bacteriophage sp.]